MWSLQKAREVSSKRTTIVQFKMIVLIVLTWEKFSEEYARFLLTYIDKADQMILVVLSTCPMYIVKISSYSSKSWHCIFIKLTLMVHIFKKYNKLLISIFFSDFTVERLYFKKLIKNLNGEARTYQKIKSNRYFHHKYVNL